MVESSSGRKIQGQIAHIPGSEVDVTTQERAFMIHWEVGRLSCTFKVRVRCGWASFREYLAANASRFAAYVCSKGKLEYIQLIWKGLDPGGRLIPPTQWAHRLTSTFPDTLTRAAQKTALVALGCVDVTRPTPPTQLAAPLVCIDDSPEAYDPEYSNSVLYVEEYRPSDGVHTDAGAVLSQVCTRLESYWAATCGEAGSFAWQAAQSFATAILSAMQKTPMESPQALAYLQVRCNKQGNALWRQMTVASVFLNDVYVSDSTDSDDDGAMHGSAMHGAMDVDVEGGAKKATMTMTSNVNMGGWGSGMGAVNVMDDVSTMHPLLREAASAVAKGLVQQQQNGGVGGSGGGSAAGAGRTAALTTPRPSPSKAASMTTAAATTALTAAEATTTPPAADEVLHASLMLKC